MEASAILGFLDLESRSRAFEHCFAKLEASSPVDPDALKTCILLGSTCNGQAIDQTNEPPVPEERSWNQRLSDLLASRIPHEPQQPSWYTALAKALLSDGFYAQEFLKERVFAELEQLHQDLSQHVSLHGEGVEHADSQKVSATSAYLQLLQCTFSLPGAAQFVVKPGTMNLLSQFIGIPVMSKIAHGALSSFLSLLKHVLAAQAAGEGNTVESLQPLGTVTAQTPLISSLFDDSVWDQFSKLDDETFKTGASDVFRTWFQWISVAAESKTELECLHQDLYWKRVRTGLLHGFGDQRKYCIGIVRQSLIAAQHDILTHAMRFRVQERETYLKAYDQYSALFETIVLDRYVNQVQACLPELSKLLDSVVTSAMITTLLTAALNPLVQEGVRKSIGNWYMEYITELQDNSSLDGHVSFLFSGFLPWATLGDLFTTTLIATRKTTLCAHGASLTAIIAKFVNHTSNHSQANNPSISSPRNMVILGVLDFILDARGKIFQSSILYLLEGLIIGLQSCSSTPLGESLQQSELDKLLRVSRIPGLPEVASDLYAEYCCQLFGLITLGKDDPKTPGFDQLQRRANLLKEPIEKREINTAADASGISISGLLSQVLESKHKSIQGDNYAPACKQLITLLDHIDTASVRSDDLFALLDAFWEEADRRQFSRPVAMHLPRLLFHPACINVCLLHRDSAAGVEHQGDWELLLSKAMTDLQRLSEGRPYIVAVLSASLRKAALQCPQILDILPFEEYICRFLTHPPSAKIEFLFEVAASEKLRQFHPHRDYYAYYGEREWHAYAAIIDLLQSFPSKQASVAKRILDQIIHPWKTQRPGSPIISKWKNVVQLQAMLLLTDFCITEVEVNEYLSAFWHALVLEAWPRYRYLLEWIIARLYCRFPGRSHIILDSLAKTDENSPITIASLMKLAVLVAPHEQEEFATTFMTQLVPFAASPKVQIRHESNYAIPIVFELALSNGWNRITENPAFISLNAFIRRLDKFQSAPWTIRTLKLDALADFTLANIFQGQYLTIESPEKERVGYEDFVTLRKADEIAGLSPHHDRVPLGASPQDGALGIQLPVKNEVQPTPPPNLASPAFFQTKSGFDIESLHPSYSNPGSDKRLASVILIASLIDNPTNLGGLSRISESFGLEALYIDDTKKMAHKDFKATSVTSEKHFPIRELKTAGVPDFLREAKTKGYEVVGIEQTDRSGILGTAPGDQAPTKDLGTLPEKCVLVLGSEKGGISAEVLAVIDRCVEIRTVGVTRSLNVQTAGAIALFEWWREWSSK